MHVGVLSKAKHDNRSEGKQMGMMQESDLDIEKLLEAACGEIEANAVDSLRKNDSVYIELLEQARNLQDSFPVLYKLYDGDGEVTMTVNEHNALKRYLDLKIQIMEKEHKQAYFQGHAHCMAYLKRIGMI